MNSKEVYQIQVTQHLAEWVATMVNKDQEDMAWDPEYASARTLADEFSIWLEGRLFGYDDKR